MMMLMIKMLRTNVGGSKSKRKHKYLRPSVHFGCGIFSLIHFNGLHFLLLLVAYLSNVQMDTNFTC